MLLSETHDIVTLIGADRRPIRVSLALERVLAYAEVPETFPAAFAHPDDVDQVVQAFDHLVSTGETSTLEYGFVTPMERGGGLRPQCGTGYTTRGSAQW
jgi:hypothetical protein